MKLYSTQTASSSTLYSQDITPSEYVEDFERAHKLTRRKGGGGHGHGGGGKDGGDDDGSGSSPLGSASSGRPGTRSFSVGTYAPAASPYANGATAQFVLPSGSLFSGREAGGGQRSQIFGTSRYGSGYPYGGYGSYVTGRPFPFIFWPVPIAPNYYGDGEYSQPSDERPGGNVSLAVVQASVNATETYRIVGDNSSVAPVMDALTSNCSVVNSTVVPFIPGNDTYPLPEQMVQWYRASSFGLSLDSYNNSASSFANMPSSNSSSALPLSADTPLPSNINMTLLHCINATIAAAVPLVAQPRKNVLLEGEQITYIILVSSTLLISFLCWVDKTVGLFRYFTRQYWERRRAGTLKYYYGK